VTRLEAARPNPFSGSTEIRFALAVPGRVRLSVYDVRGRLVVPLENGDLSAGFHVLRWDGRDGEGRPAPAGVYFVRFEAGGVQETAKLVQASRR
jgi:flagellar hook assembly protein FlgD